MEGRPNTRNKALFSCQLNMEGWPNRRNKAPFS